MTHHTPPSSPPDPPNPHPPPADADLEEFRERLRAAGHDPGRPAWTAARNRDLSQLPALQAQRELLVQLTRAVRAQLEDAQRELEAARTAQWRVRHGGGL